MKTLVLRVFGMNSFGFKDVPFDSRMCCIRTGVIQGDFGDLTRRFCVRGRAHRPQRTPIHTPYAHSSHSRIFASKASEIPGETVLRVAFQFPVQPFLRLDHCLSRIARITNVKRLCTRIQTSTSCTFFPWSTSSCYWHFETKIAWFQITAPNHTIKPTIIIMSRFLDSRLDYVTTVEALLATTLVSSQL